MPKYIAVAKQAGEGCDYTIACGQKAVVFEAADIQEATDIAFKKFHIDQDALNDWYIDGDGEGMLESWKLYEISDTPVHDLLKIMYNLQKLLHAEQLRKEQTKQEREERALLEQLKAKYDV